ncbi:dihydroneopterin aldolase family protein [Methanocaldococcus infernus]
MRVEEKELFKEYFKNLSDKERVIFEGGISLGTIFHQFVGTPVSKNSKYSLERAIEEAIKNQPCVYDVKVKINYDGEEYIELRGDMLDVELMIKVNNVLGIFRLEYIEELNYPLMYVKEIKEVRE